MKKIFYLISVVSFLLFFNLANAMVQKSLDWNRPITYPLLNTPIQVNVYGNPAIKFYNSFELTSICNDNRGYNCLTMSDTPDYSNGISSIDYIINDKRYYDPRTVLFSNNLYKYTAYVETERLSKKPDENKANSSRITSFSFYSSPRPENGLMDWDYRLLNKIVQAITGTSLNRNALNKCYIEAKTYARGCDVQSGKVNGLAYVVNVGFLYFNHTSNNKGYRNFSLKILPK